MLSTGVMSGLGFVFWIICSKIYTPSEIGLATSLLSVSTLLTSLSLFGLNNVIIRFLPSSTSSNALISGVLAAVALGGILSGIIFSTWAQFTQNPIMQLGSFFIVVPIFIGYLFLQTTSIIFDSIFIANRYAKYIFFRNTLFSISKLALPFFFISLGSIGIIYSITIATLLSWYAGLLWLVTIFKFRPSSPKTNSIEGMKRFAAGNYIGNIFAMAPVSFLPLIIVSQLGAKEAAFFYMPLMIVTLINVIPSANAQSLFAEASNDEAGLVVHLRKAFRHLFMILLPAVVLVILVAFFVLSFFGEEYANEGGLPLQILAIASLVGSLNYFGDTILNIKKKSGLYIFMNAFSAFTIISLSYIFAAQGLTAISFAWLMGQIITLFVYTIINRNLIAEIWVGNPKKNMNNKIHDDGFTEIGKQRENPKLSIVIVAYNTGSELLDCLHSLEQQINGDFETILVDNGTIDQAELQGFNLKYIWTGKNLGPSMARNIGLNIARADIIAFLDDDAITQNDWTKCILREFENQSTIALRGKIIPKNERGILNQIQSHYDLGKNVINYYIDLEGNSAFKKLCLTEVGGFKPSLFGHEGAELSYKLQKKNPGFHINYTPDVVIFHDYADSFYHLFKKSFRHGLMASRLNDVAPEIVDYIRKFNNSVPKIDKSFIVKMIIKISGVFYLLGKLSFRIKNTLGHR